MPPNRRSDQHQALVPHPRAGPSNRLRTIIGGRFEMRRSIGAGAVGRVVEGKDLRRDNEVVIKVATTAEKIALLVQEEQVYRSIRLVFGTNPRGFAKHCYFENITNVRASLVMEKLGPTIAEMLQQYHSRHRRYFSTNRIMSMGIQLVRAVRDLHTLGFIHLDIEPDNILVGSENERHVCLIDFDNAKRFMSDGNGHIEYRATGSREIHEFSSMAKVLGYPVGRRDDLESVGLCMIFMKRGRLPWFEGATEVTGSDFVHFLRAAVRRTFIPELCRGLGEHMENYFVHVRSLPYYKQPDYDHLISLLEATKDSVRISV